MRRRLLFLSFVASLSTSSPAKANNLFDTVSNTINSAAEWVVDTAKKSIHPYAPYYASKATAIFIGWGATISIEEALTSRTFISTRLKLASYGLVGMIAAANTWISAK